MLRPLLYLCAIVGMAGAQQNLGSFANGSVVNISSCPFKYYGQEFQELYVTINPDEMVLCFGNNGSDLQQDCILGPSFQSTAINVSSGTLSAARNNSIKSLLLNLQGDGSCELVLELQNTTPKVTLGLVAFQTQGALVFEYPSNGTFNFTTLAPNVNETISFSNGTSIFAAADLSSCRYEGTTVRYDQSQVEKCVNLTCSDTAVLITSALCGPLEHCSNNSCMFDLVCTVTGPTVVEFDGTNSYVPDRCAYTLLNISDVVVTGKFLERRRQDMTFLNSVALSVNHTHFYLDQGGIVQVNSTRQSLNSSAQLFEGVALSKDHTGVTAKSSGSNMDITVFFDGYTAQIHLKGPGQNPYPSGFCYSNGASAAELRTSQLNSSDCDTRYNDTTDSTIDCTLMADRCKVLSKPPFAACHSHMDPNPYIAACNDTMCKYPSVDGLYCQFLNAYVKACDLHANSTMGDWWTNYSCSPPRALCQDKYCSAHEFCALASSTDEACFCRAIFASSYTSNDTLGEVTECMGSTAKVTLVGCLLEEKGINYTNLHLNDANCTGHKDTQDHRVTFSFNSSNTCGALITTNGSHLSYANSLVSSINGSVVREYEANVSFTCHFSHPDNKTMSFRIIDNSVATEVTSLFGDYNLSMKAYTDSSHTRLVDTDVELNQKIWVKLETEGLEGGFVTLVIDHCWGTNESSPDADLKHDLIVNSCASSADGTTEVTVNGERTWSSFAFNMFRFYDYYGDIFLHCQLHLCDSANNRTCVPTCPPSKRKRRSSRTQDVNEPLTHITMIWTN